MTGDPRAAAALRHIDFTGSGLEIGPSYSPLLPKSSGRKIQVVDHASRAELTAKYRSMGLTEDKINNIEDVDYIWRGGSLVDAVGQSHAFDFIIASHLIEHTTDLIGFLMDCESLLTENGKLALVVPDSRYCFDRFRPPTSVGHIVDAHHYPKPFHPPGAFVDHHVYATQRDGQIAWSPATHSDFEVQFSSLDEVQSEISTALRQDTYRDIHRWVFTPTSFVLLLDCLRELGYHRFGPAGGVESAGHEFYVTVTLQDGPEQSHSRVERLVAIESEVLTTSRRFKDTVASLEQAIKAAEVRTTEAERGRELLQGALHDVMTSRSWRMTRPLREVSRIARRLRPR